MLPVVPPCCTMANDVSYAYDIPNYNFITCPKRLPGKVSLDRTSLGSSLHG